MYECFYFESNKRFGDILKFLDLTGNLEPIWKADEEELDEQLEENDLLPTAEEGSSEVMIIGDTHFWSYVSFLRAFFFCSSKKAIV